MKRDFETLLAGGEVVKRADERVSFRHLRTSPDAVCWIPGVFRPLTAGHVRPERS